MSWSSFLWVGLGGFFGANARYWVANWVDERYPRTFGHPLPLGTLFVNVLGSFLLAFFLTYVAKRLTVPESIKLLVGTGFFGAYTTFSTYANESIALINQGHWVAGLSHIILTNVICLLAVTIGIVIANQLF